MGQWSKTKYLHALNEKWNFIVATKPDRDEMKTFTLTLARWKAFADFVIN